MDNTQPFWAKCTNCKKIWEACRVPMELTQFGKMMRKVKCPFCMAGPNKITMAKQRDGVLLEELPA